MSKRWRLALGLPFFALMLCHVGMRVYLGSLALEQYSRRGWNAAQRDGRTIITQVGGASTATGVLQQGDEIVALWSERPEATSALEQSYWRVPPGTRYTLTVRREGQVLELPFVTTRLRPEGPQGVFLLAVALTCLIFIVTGAAVFLLKPDDRQAWLLSLMLSALVALLPLNLFIQQPRWAFYLALLAQSASTIFLPIFWHFFLLFPARSPWLRRWPRLERLLYLPYLFLLLPVFVLRSVLANFWPALPERDVFDYWAGKIIIIVAIIYMLGGFVSMFVNYRAVSSIARRKLRVVLAGCAIGFLNLFLMPLGETINLHRQVPTLWRWLDGSLMFTLPLIPLSFAYAIARHKVIPISLIIRRGVRYVLVSRGSILLEVIAVTITVTAVLTYIFNRFRPSGLVIGLVSAAAGILAWKLASTLHDKYLAPIIDRRFFRQSYDAQQIIHDLVQSLRTTTSLPELTEQVATKLQTALQTESVTMLLRSDATGDYQSYYSCEYRVADGRAVQCNAPSHLPHDAAVVARLSATRQPLELDLTDKDSSLPAAEQATLKQMKAALLLPLIGKDSAATHNPASLLGIIALGARLGDLPFSGEDKDLLVSVAGPTTLAIENAQLVERMIAEARRRQELEAESERRARELEEARQLQLSMLPKTVPQLPQFDIAAYMKTATEVGGDYYDFHQSDNGELTIVVGDATGHGLKAGTMVAATKSLLNHLASNPNTVEILSQSSRALKRMNFRGLFMAMTLAKVNGHHLTLSIAGMPPALLYRARENRVEEVTLKGVPLGSMTNYQYRVAEMRLAPDDILVLMSDGFPERFNQQGEMLGYARASEVLRACPTCSSQEIIDRFLSLGEAWAEGRQQDDDVTFVVLKVR